MDIMPHPPANRAARPEILPPAKRREAKPEGAPIVVPKKKAQAPKPETPKASAKKTDAKKPATASAARKQLALPPAPPEVVHIPEVLPSNAPIPARRSSRATTTRETPAAPARGEFPWTGAAHIFREPPKSVADALRMSNLDWQVECRDLLYRGNDGEMVESDARAVVRADTGAHLGTVGGAFCPLQNIRAFEIFQPLVESGRLILDSAGALNGGATVFIQARLNLENLVIKGDDVITPYVLLSHGHGIGRAIAFGVTPKRLWCSNQLQVALTHPSAQIVRISHTMNAQQRLSTLAGLTETAADGIVHAAGIYRQLAERRLEAGAAEAYVLRLMGMEEPMREGVFTPSEGSDAVKLWAELKGSRATRAGRVLDLIRGGIGNDGKTWWSALNGWTEFNTWEGGYRSTNNRLDSLFFGKGANEIGAGMDLAAEMAGVEISAP